MALRYGLVGSWAAFFWAGWGLVGVAAAGMIGSPVATLQRHAIGVGVEGSLINRELAFETGASPDIDMSEVLFRGSYGVVDWLNVFLSLGSVDDDFNIVNFSGLGADLKFLAEPAMAYGGGVKLTLYKFPKFLLGVGGQFEQFTLDSPSTPTPSVDAKLKWLEYRFFVGAHLNDVPYFVPYGGLYFTGLHGELEFSSSFPTTNVEASQSVGLFYGGDFKIWNKLVLSAE
ncbi:MAG: hypothetical protein ACREIQ_11660, partial [Nitrospiria bacterium]